MRSTNAIPFHGAKLAILVGDAVLTIQRDDVADIPWPGCWDLPGGARENGESPRDCVRRETYEELGIDVPAELLRWGGRWPSPPSYTWFFVAEWPDFDATTIRFGNEGQRFALAPTAWFLTRAKGIPGQKSRLHGYIERRRELLSLVLPA